MRGLIFAEQCQKHIHCHLELYKKELPKPTGESFASWRKAYELRAQEQAREAAAAEPSANKRARNTHHGR